FPRLADRDDLWQVLVLLTVRKAANLREHALRARRGGGRVWLATDQAAGGEADARSLLAGVIGQEPTPEFSAQMAEECARLLDRLGEPELRTIALRKMEGYTNAEIAAELGCVPRTIERRL